MKSSKPYRYNEARDLLATILSDMRILAGDDFAPSNVTWQDVAGTLACNLKVLAVRVEAAREGYTADGPVVFPSPDDCTEE